MCYVCFKSSLPFVTCYDYDYLGLNTAVGLKILISCDLLHVDDQTWSVLHC